MNSQIGQLASLAKLYLLQEYQNESWIWADSDVHAFFRKKASDQPPKKFQTGPACELEPRPQPSNPLSQSAVKAAQPVSLPSINKTPAQVKPPLPSSNPVLKKELPAKEAIEKPGNTHFNLEPFQNKNILNISDFKGIVSQKFPQIKLLDAHPDDSKAKEIRFKWQKKEDAETIIINVSGTAAETAFLENLASAIRSCFSSCEVVNASKIEAERGWDAIFSQANIRLILCPQWNKNNFPLLQGLLATSLPLCQMQAPETYLRSPGLKASLWKTIREKLSSK